MTRIWLSGEVNRAFVIMSVGGVVQVLSFVVLQYVCSQEYFEELHMANHGPELSQIPKKFEIRSNTVHNAVTQFEKYAHQIQRLSKTNPTIIYKVKVEVKPHKKKFTKKLLKKDKTKKYNVPLKKNSMKLSNFETFLRKMAEQNTHNSQNYDFHMPTSTASQQILTTKQMKMKFKPIPSKLNNYTKVIKPVRNRLITLTV